MSPSLPLRQYSHSACLNPRRRWTRLRYASRSRHLSVSDSEARSNGFSNGRRCEADRLVRVPLSNLTCPLEDIQRLLVQITRNLNSAAPTSKILITGNGGGQRPQTDSREKRRLTLSYFFRCCPANPLFHSRIGAKE